MIREVSFGALAFPKPYKGQDNVEAASQISNKLGIKLNSLVFRTTNATTDGVLFMFQDAKEEAAVIARAQKIGLQYVQDSSPNEEIGKRAAKAIIRSLGIA